MDVPTCAWPAGGMLDLAKAARPRRLRGESLPSAAWLAHQRWHSADYLAAVMHPLSGVWQRPAPMAATQQSAGSRSFVYFAERGEAGGNFGMRAPPHAPPESSRVTEHESLRYADFVSAADRGALLYCSHDLAALGEAAVADVHPLAPFDLRSSIGGGSTREERHQPTRGIVWLGAGRAVTHAHYDTSHNMFVQIVGQKLFTLWPPAAHDNLHIFPSRHSMHRQSSWNDPPATARELSVEVLLEPGDALYLPPFYAHHVAALSNLSISVAVWSQSDECRRKDELETLPLPWEAEWSRRDVAVAAALFVRALLAGVHANASHPASAGRDMLHRQLSSRFAPLRQLPARAQEGLLPTVGLEQLHADCAMLTSDAESDSSRVAELRRHVAAGASRVAEAVRAVSPTIGTVELALGNYLEALAEFATGGRREAIHDFLAVCVLGGWAVS